MRLFFRAMMFAGLLLALPSMVHAQAEWQAMAGDLIKSEKPGYGGLSGVIVDPKSGDVFIFLSDKGLYRSTDRGKTWTKPGTMIKGRTETPGCMVIDPVGGKRMILALVYGSPIAVSPDLGQTWKILDQKSNHVDWFAADWSDPDLKFLLTLKHESGGTLLASHDGGEAFDTIGKDFGPAWIFDAKTAVVAEMKSKNKPNPKILRTTDAGKTFEPVGDYDARVLPHWHQGALYWLVDGALISSTDKGQTWKKISDVKNGRCGPVFGKTQQHLFVLTTAGILESTDGGATWGKALPLAKEMKQINFMTWLEYDAIHDVLYTARMGAELFKLERKK